MTKFRFFVLISFFLTIIGRSVQDQELCENRVNQAEDISSSCVKQLKVLCARKDILYTLWDSSSRILHSGISATSSLDLGNYDECLALNENVQVDTEEINLKGKFCSGSWNTLLTQTQLENYVYNLETETSLHNKSLIDINAGEITGDIIPLSGSLCIPDSCKISEFSQVFHPYNFKVTYSEKCLDLDEDKNLSTSELIITIGFGVIVVLMILSTSIHLWMHYLKKQEPHDLLLAFSMFYNGKKLVTIIPKRSDQISCLYGIRFLCMSWVVVGHTFASLQTVPQFNQKDIIAWPEQLYSQYVQTAKFAVDTFFFLSGFLNAFLYLKMTKNTPASQQIKGVPLIYLHRYLRLTPAVAALYLVTVSFWKLTSSGPLWHNFYSRARQQCVDNWLSYFLYFQNYNGKFNICWMQTWYLSVDMQMFILAPIVLIPLTIFLRTKYKSMITGLGALAIFCIGISISVPYIIDDYSNNFDTQSRLSDYIVGIIAGIVLHRNKGKHVTINKFLNVFLWVLAIGTMLFIALYMNDVSTNPTKLKETLFNEISRPIWCLCIMWIVFSCYFGYGGVFNHFLSNPFFEVASRLTYCIYIIHNMIIFNFISQLRTYFYFSDYQVYYHFCGHIVTCLIIGTLWTLAFEGPMIVLDKMLFKWIGTLGKTKKNETGKEQI